MTVKHKVGKVSYSGEACTSNAPRYLEPVLTGALAAYG